MSRICNYNENFSGAEGLLQGMMLSLGGLKFSHKHLEMTIHPKDLHRDLQVGASSDCLSQIILLYLIYSENIQT